MRFNVIANSLLRDEVNMQALNNYVVMSICRLFIWTICENPLFSIEVALILNSGEPSE